MDSRTKTFRLEMAVNANGGGGRPPAPFMDTSRAQVVKKEHAQVVKKENAVDSNPISNHHSIQNNRSNNKGISIAERRAAKCGFNASSINVARVGIARPSVAPPLIRSPYFTVPPGISPSSLLESPIMLPNTQALSPTTGTFSYPSPNHESLNMKLKIAATKDPVESSSSASNTSGVPYLTNLNHSSVENKPFGEFEYRKELHEKSEKASFVDDATFSQTNPAIFSSSLEAKNEVSNPINDPSGKEINTHQNQEKLQKGGAYNVPKEAPKYSDDGYYWRKYGQKHVKGSEYPRSYFKCTSTSCPVKKKVERSHDGQITEIVYKGSHNHPKPKDMTTSIVHHQGSGSSCLKTEGGKDFDDLEMTSSASFLSDFSDPTSRSANASEPAHETNQEFSSTFGGLPDSDVHDRDHEASPESISLNEDDNDTGECEPKKRKKESFPSETNTISRSTREPRVIVQIETEIDILDDGYRWRKYGQKVVKGNPNPRSYYKCTTPGCPVRKHVERAANDIKYVVTTYEGKHNHEIPSSKNVSLIGTSDIGNVPVTNNGTLSAASPTAPKLDQAPKVGKHTQDLPLYMDRKPMLNYNELMMRPAGSLNTATTHELNFGGSSRYPFSFPPLIPPVSYHSSLIFTNGNRMKTTFPSSSLNYHPMLPDYMPLQSSMNHRVPTGSGNGPSVGGNNYNMIHSYAAVQSSIQGQDINSINNNRSNSNSKILKPKEEQDQDGGDLYDAHLPMHNHHHHQVNGSI